MTIYVQTCIRPYISDPVDGHIWLFLPYNHIWQILSLGLSISYNDTDCFRSESDL